MVPEVKDKQEKDKIETKPDKNGKPKSPSNPVDNTPPPPPLLPWPKEKANPRLLSIFNSGDDDPSLHKHDQWPRIIPEAFTSPNKHKPNTICP
nr:hypothetical protein [Tanacetum cinerariifolium]